MNIDSKWQGASVPAGIIKTPHQGVCPDGWHIPTKEEWETLSANVNYLSLQAPYNNLWPIASNLSGFSALPVGSYELGHPRNAGEVIYFWSATEYDGEYAYKFVVYTTKSSISGRTGGGKHWGFSVRCFQDAPATP